MDFLSLMKKKYDFTAEKLNLGGGYGIWYTDEDRKIAPEDYAEYLVALINEVKAKAKALRLAAARKTYKVSNLPANKRGKMPFKTPFLKRTQPCVIPL